MSDTDAPTKEYVLLNTLFWRSVPVFENGVTRRDRTKYKRGDTLELPESEAQRLLDLGAIAPKSDLSDEDQESLVASTATLDVTSRGDGGVTPEGQRLADDGSEEDEDENLLSPDSDGDEGDEDDGLDDKSYADLRAEAKDRGLDTTGTADDLRERLRNS